MEPSTLPLLFLPGYTRLYEGPQSYTKIIGTLKDQEVFVLKTNRWQWVCLHMFQALSRTVDVFSFFVLADGNTLYQKIQSGKEFEATNGEQEFIWDSPKYYQDIFTKPKIVLRLIRWSTKFKTSYRILSQSGMVGWTSFLG